uniref:Uncharacterized protein n=1 Tax=Aegilops tauschii subsp. strangulata TaxID=200361 RepID=A0A453NMN3_AEGTS
KNQSYRTGLTSDDRQRATPRRSQRSRATHLRDRTNGDHLLLLAAHLHRGPLRHPTGLPLLQALPPLPAPPAAPRDSPPRGLTQGVERVRGRRREQGPLP